MKKTLLWMALAISAAAFAAAPEASAPLALEPAQPQILAAGMTADLLSLSCRARLVPDAEQRKHRDESGQPEDPVDDARHAGKVADVQLDHPVNPSRKFVGGLEFLEQDRRPDAEGQGDQGDTASRPRSSPSGRATCPPGSDPAPESPISASKRGTALPDE